MNVPLTPIRCLYRAVDLYGRKTGVVSGPSSFTYAQFGERCERLAAGLLSEGIHPGDRVAYLSFNNHQLLEGYYGPPLIRAIAMPLNVRLQPAELTAILNHAGASMLVFETEFAPLIETLRKACPTIKRYVAIDQPVPQADLFLEDLLARDRIPRPDLFSFDENEIAELFYTSGSTGTPKGVMLSHRTLYLHTLGLLVSFPSDDSRRGTPHHPLVSRQRLGTPAEHHPDGRQARHGPPLRTGLRYATHPGRKGHRDDPGPHHGQRSPQLSGTGKVRHFEHESNHHGRGRVVARADRPPGAGVPLRRKGGLRPHRNLSRGHLCPDQRHGELRRRRRPALAPLGGRLAAGRLRSSRRRFANARRTARYADRRRSGSPRRQRDGWLLRRADATKAAITDGWLHTGDMAVWDEENYIHIVDRKKDIIISGGENISSIDVEKAIFAHPAVLECAVVSAPDPQWGEIPVAIIVLKPGQQLNKEQLLSFLKPRIAKFKMPRLVKFVEGPLPKTGTGKMLKRQLREAFWSGKATRVQG